MGGIKHKDTNLKTSNDKSSDVEDQIPIFLSPTSAMLKKQQREADLESGVLETLESTNENDDSPNVSGRKKLKKKKTKIQGKNITPLPHHSSQLSKIKNKKKKEK